MSVPAFPKKDVYKIAVTGAAGQIGYSLVPMIASGAIFGPQQAVRIALLDLEVAKQGMEGLRMELYDSAYPCLAGVDVCVDQLEAFRDADVAIFCGSFPRKAGMERGDLLEKNKDIFKVQGNALKSAPAAAHCRVLVVGNPANTNALILSHFTEGHIDPRNVTALTRLDHNRAVSVVAQRAGVLAGDVKNVIIWGNHSSTQVPDITFAKVKGGAVSDASDAFWSTDFVSGVRTRGAEVIKTRGASSATSAGRAIVSHMRDWLCGTAEGEFVSMAVHTDGTHYGVPAGLVYSMPCTCKDGVWSVVSGLSVTDSVKGLMAESAKELQEEKDLALKQ
eukprot:PhM_4_TR2738/c0_g1_i1/m.52282/K00025/MDH1; malate dehydrogenase